MFRILSSIIVLFLSAQLLAQCDGWQQRVEYELFIDLDVEDHNFEGTERIKYYNNSPDTLRRIFFHLYFNAFKPGSMMDVRSRTIEDPDRRIGDRISFLTKEEQGELHVLELKQDGKRLKIEHVGTILEVELNKALLPGKSTVLEMEFNGQVPVQVRRSGRNNREGVAYSMSQWYPKLCEYDPEGWHANPYVAREFHGVWGDFDVKIKIDKHYTVAGTGYLQNANKIGHGYEDEGVEVPEASGAQLIWHFKAPQVHDFVWAADLDYLHEITELKNGTELHFFYKNDSALFPSWEKLPAEMVKCFEYMNERFGEYPYKKYSFIQAGDGGMEYPMATLITADRSFGSLVGTSVHEAVHSWYQGVLASNESLYPWMDEGFTSYADSYVMANLFPKAGADPLNNKRRGYLHIVEIGKEEPLTTHDDHYKTNLAHGIAAYSKGALFLDQLSYIVGQEQFDACMKDLFRRCKFKHPTPTDVKRIFEKNSGLELDWYFNHWIETTNTIDYSIRSVEQIGDSTYITLERIGVMMMPIDLFIEKKDGSSEMHNIPLRIMRGNKAAESPQGIVVQADWPWTHPTYTLALAMPVSEIDLIVIDPSLRMADIDRSNNVFVLPDGFKFMIQR